MKLTFLGTGTSYGVPYIGCDCAVCTSRDPNNKRLRCSIVVEASVEGAEATGSAAATRLLVDTSPDLRQQLLGAGIAQVDAVLWTHLHNDHVIGLDDIRPLCDRQGYIDGYAGAETMERLVSAFGYIFESGRAHGGFPRMTPHLVEPGQVLQLGALRVTAIPIVHFKRTIFAFRFEAGGRSLVYATDCSAIPDASWEPLGGADVLVLDALRHRAHPAHFSVEEAIAAAGRLRAGRTLFTHIAHDLDHDATNAMLPHGIELAYDGLVVQV